MNLTCKKGEKILLTDNCSQTYAGVVKSVNVDLGRILLADITQLPEHKSISGYRNFDKAEIVEIKKYEGDVFNIQGDDQICLTPSGKLSESQHEDIKKLQNEFRFIRDLGSNFYSAISLLKTCQRIGVHGKDVSKGRFGRASVLAVSTPSNIFVFDLLTLGDEVFRRGLKQVLESPETVKVVHDCRLLSDCLRNKHLVNIRSIRDVEAEDIMVVFQERRVIRRHSRSLEYLCKLYLGAEVEGLGEEGDAWSERPLRPDLLECLARLASYLIPLQEAIERKYLQLLVDASNLYNDHLKSLDLFDYLHDEPKKTLRKEISKLLAPRNQARGDFRSKKVD